MVWPRYFLKWYNEIYFKYELFQLKKKCLLILDYAQSHKSDYIMEEFQKNQTELIFIPTWAMGYLQPLDIGINKIFKQKLK